MSFTAEELHKEINEAYENKPEREDEFFIDAYYEVVTELDTRLGKVVLEEANGGQGDGAPIEVVISIGDRFFQMDGYYSSWDSSRMDGELYEVEQKEVVRKEYRRIRNA